MNPAEIEIAIREELAAVLELEPSDIGSDQHFYDDLDGDSLQKLEFVARLESRFAIQLTDDEATELNTVTAAVGVLKGK